MKGSWSGLGARKQLLEVPWLDRHALGPGLLRARLGGLGEVTPGEHRLRARVLDVELDLAALEQRVVVVRLQGTFGGLGRRGLVRGVVGLVEQTQVGLVTEQA